MSNATRFINAYNTVDKRLRAVYGLKASLTFSDTIRKAASFSPLVRKFEDDLFDYGRLRNAIVHNSETDIVIAEPHESVVEHFEHIAELVSTPPRALNTVAKNAATLMSYDGLQYAIRLMTNNNYSYVPIIKDGIIIGVLTNKSIVETVAKHFDSLSEYLTTAKVEDVLTNSFLHYSIVKHDATLDYILQLFTDNRKLGIVILTENGVANSKIKGIVTTGDLIDIHKMLDNY